MAPGPAGELSAQPLPSKLVVSAAGVAIWKNDPRARRGDRLGPSFQLDLEQFRKVDPKLVLFEQVGSIDTRMPQPRSLAVGGDGTLYVGGQDAIAMFDAQGQPIRSFAVTGNVTALDVDENGKIYAALKDHVEVLDASGERLAKWPAFSRDSWILSVELANGEVYLADKGEKSVLRFKGDGTLINRIGADGADAKNPPFIFYRPHFDIAMGPDGLLRVVDPGRFEVRLYTPEGQLKGNWGKAGNDLESFSGCCNPTDILVLADGSTVTAEKGIVRIKLYGPDGKFVGVVAPPAELPEEVQEMDLAVGPRGIYALDRAAKTVRIYAKKDGQREDAEKAE